MNKPTSLLPHQRLCVALDLDTLAEMTAIVERIGPTVTHYKIGHQLMTAVGPQAIHWLTQAGKTVFLDLKLHEIPNSVAAAVRAAGRQGVEMVSVHAAGGRAMLQAAVEAAAPFDNLKILALTVVTGLDDSDLVEIGFAHRCTALVDRLADLAQRAGCHGIIASPLETPRLRAILPEQMWIVTPGVRPTHSPADDQQRIATPAAAIRSGASMIVVGRPVVQSADPAAAAAAIVEQIRLA